MSPPINIDGSEIQEATIDGQNVSEITIDGQQTAGFVDIPDEELLQARYDATELSFSDGEAVSTWGDETGNGNDLTTENDDPTYVSDGINGNPVVSFDGSNDNMTVSWTDISPPIQIYYAGELGTSGVNQYLHASANNDHVVRDNGSGSWEIRDSGDAATGGTPDTLAHIFSALYEDGTLTLRLDGTEIAATSATISDMGEFVAADNNPSDRGDRFADIDYGEILIYDGSSTPSDVESYLSSGWGITI